LGTKAGKIGQQESRCDEASQGLLFDPLIEIESETPLIQTFGLCGHAHGTLGAGVRKLTRIEWISALLSLDQYHPRENKVE